MSDAMEQEGRNPEYHPSRRGDLAQLTAWAQTVVSRSRWANSVLSPWVQRSLQTHVVSPETGMGAGQRRQTALSEGHTRALLDRVYRQVEESRVWRPDMGSVAPATFERFASDIVERHQPFADKYLIQSPPGRPEGSSELTLAPGGLVGMGFGLEPRWSEPRMRPPTPAPSPPPAVQRSDAPTMPPARPAPRQPSKAMQRGRVVRAFSRVEELAPVARAPTIGEPVPPSIPAPETAEQRLDEPPPRPEVDQEMPVRAPARPAEEGQVEPTPSETPTPPSVEVEPPRPPVSREVTPVKPPSPPVVQPQVERAEPTPSEVPTPPSVEAEPPRPPISREVTPVRPETVSEPGRPAGPPSSPVVQPQVERAEPTPSGVPTPPSAEAGPPGPPASREVASVRPKAVSEPGRPAGPPSPPVVQRQVERAEPTPSEVPALPSAEAEPPGPPVSREVAPVRPKAVPEPGRPAEPPSPPVVQRQVEWAEPVPPEAPAPPPSSPVGREVAPAEPEAPPVVQRRGEFDEPAIGLEKDVLARGVSKARLPLIEPLRSASGFEREQGRAETSEALAGDHGDLAQAKPVGQTAILPQVRVQARFEDREVQAVDRARPYAPPGPLFTPRQEPVVETAEPTRAGVGRFQTLGDELPLPPVGRPASTALVQRQPSVSPARAEMISRQEETAAETAEAPSEAERPAEEEQDLDRLARQVYPLIKRMLAVERERRSGRWSGRA